MRGLQIGYRPKTNSYDGLTVDTFNELITDLALFGANMIELIPKAFDDAPYSPHYRTSRCQMHATASASMFHYGIQRAIPRYRDLRVTVACRVITPTRR